MKAASRPWLALVVGAPTWPEALAYLRAARPLGGVSPSLATRSTEMKSVRESLIPRDALCTAGPGQLGRREKKP